jgi:hypothetical protein
MRPIGGEIFAAILTVTILPEIPALVFLRHCTQIAGRLSCRSPVPAFLNAPNTQGGRDHRI